MSFMLEFILTHCSNHAIGCWMRLTSNVLKSEKIHIFRWSQKGSDRKWLIAFPCPPTKSKLLHVNMHMYTHTHAKAHSRFISLSLPLPPFSYYFTQAHTHWIKRKEGWVMRAFGSPFCHHSDTKVPPTGCVTSKECLSTTPPPTPSLSPTPRLRWWWDTPPHGTYSERAETHNTTPVFLSVSLFLFLCVTCSDRPFNNIWIYCNSVLFYYVINLIFHSNSTVILLVYLFFIVFFIVLFLWHKFGTPAP